MRYAAEESDSTVLNKDKDKNKDKTTRQKDKKTKVVQ